ncbi:MULTISPECIES: helix-turn-helix domain-containing protein [Actinomycetes]|uniref:Helix-turn-helix transcriptional regulator n=2 Tax=Microbacteriaceae TaxID=85023 RepID=A0ABV3LL98_9MICO|nr:helix-turn-helix transcriptional regulator [Microbacterium profundi]
MEARMPRYTVERPHDFGDLIAGMREEQGVTQDELADRLGFSRSYLSELESGKSTVQLARLFRTLHSLGVSVEVSWESATESEDD